MVLFQLLLFSLLNLSYTLSFKVLICPALTVRLNRINGTDTLDKLSVDLVLTSTEKGVNSITFQNFNHDPSQETVMPPVYRSLWKAPQNSSQWKPNLNAITDGPGSLQFLDTNGNSFGPGINIGIQSSSFYNMDGTFFANISKCYGGNQQVDDFDFNYTVCCTRLINLDWMPTIDYFSCGELNSQTTFYDDKGAISSSFEVQYTLTDALVTANLVNYTRPGFDVNSNTLVSVNYDASNPTSPPGRFSNCTISGTDSKANCLLQIENDLYLDSSYHFVISNQVGGVKHGALNGRLIRRNDTWVTPWYTLYSIDNPCWEKNESATDGSVSIISSTKTCCTRFNVGSIGNRNNINMLLSLGLIYITIAFLRKLSLL